MSAFDSILPATRRTAWAAALSRQRVPLALVGVMVCTMVAAWTAGDALSSASQRLQQAQAAQRRAAAELEAGRELDARLKPALERLQELDARGLTRPPQRMQWQRVVAHSASPRTPGDARAATVRASFSTPRVLVGNTAPPVTTPRPATDSPAPALRLLATPLQLNADLRHEGALLQLLSSIEAERSAIVITRSCSMDRLADAADGDRAATLRASCALEWLTLDRSMAEVAR